MKVQRIFAAFAAVAGLVLFLPSQAIAHCDGLDGPVVKAALKALEARNPDGILIWVQAADEPEVRAAFEKTLAVRALSAQAKELADRYFFETVVRLHRVGEGAPYTGLKPAGRDLGPAIPAADKAIADRSSGPLAQMLVETLQQELTRQFEHVMATRSFPRGDLKAGRESVRAYVEFMHYVERLHDAITGSAQGHFEERN